MESAHSPAFAFCFNTQPPEGGCKRGRSLRKSLRGFQHTAARRRLPDARRYRALYGVVSTHSRPKAAAAGEGAEAARGLFQHTAARRRLRWPPPDRPR